MSLDRKKPPPPDIGGEPHYSLDEPSVEFEPSKNFLSLSPENLNLNRSCQQLNKFNHHHHHGGSKRYELITRTSTESKDTDSSSGSKKHGRKSKSPTR